MESFGINVNFGDIENQRKWLECSRDHGLTVNNIHIPGGDDELDDLLGSTTNNLKTENDFSIAEWYMDHLDEIELSCAEPLQGKITHVDIECNEASHSNGSYSALEYDAAIARDITWTIPKPVTIVVHVNRQPAHALVNTGSLADFMSLSLADQLKVEHIQLEKPLPIQLAVQGS